MRDNGALDVLNARTYFGAPSLSENPALSPSDQRQMFGGSGSMSFSISKKSGILDLGCVCTETVGGHKAISKGVFCVKTCR